MIGVEKTRFDFTHDWTLISKSALTYTLPYMPMVHTIEYITPSQKQTQTHFINFTLSLQNVNPGIQFAKNS